ncbi:hypothetical protein ACFL4T_07150 [candidate division KSB1 bacterium]
MTKTIIMEEATKEKIADKAGILEALRNRKFDNVMDLKSLLKLEKINKSDYNEIIEEGQKNFESVLTPQLFDISAAIKIKDFLDLEDQDISKIVLKSIKQLIDFKEPDKAIDALDIFNSEENNLVLSIILHALINKQIEASLKIIYKYKIDNYIDPDKKFNVPKEIKDVIYDIKKKISEYYDSMKKEHQYKYASELSKFLANKKSYQIELATYALDNKYYTDAKNIIEDFKLFENELQQPEIITSKLSDLRIIKKKHYNMQLKNNKFDTALLIAELDPDRGRDNSTLINNTANMSLNENLEELSKIPKTDDNKTIIENKLKQIHSFLNKYEIKNEILIEHGTHYLQALFNAEFYPEARFFYKTLKDRFETDINKDQWEKVISQTAKLVEEKLLFIIDNKSVTDLAEFVKHFEYKFVEGSEIHLKIDNRIRDILNKSIEKSFDKALYIKASKTLKVLKVKTTPKTRKVAEQVFTEVLSRAKVDVSEALEKGKTYNKSQGENSEDVYLLGQAFRIRDYEDALVNAFIIYSKLLEFQKLDSLYSKNRLEFEGKKTKSRLIVFLQKEKKEWKKNESAVTEFDKLGTKFFGEQFFEKQSSGLAEDTSTEHSLLYNIFIAPWLHIIKAIFHIFFKRFFDKD